MSLKTFNIDSEIYSKFSEYCKAEGLSMSKKIEKFIASEIEDLGLSKEEGKTRKEKEKSKKKKKTKKLEETKDEEHSFMKYC